MFSYRNVDFAAGIKVCGMNNWLKAPGPQPDDYSRNASFQTDRCESADLDTHAFGDGTPLGKPEIAKS